MSTPAYPVPAWLVPVARRLTGELHAVTILRVSGGGLRQMVNVEASGKAKMGGLAAIQYIDSLGEDLLADSAEGERARSAAGAVSILRRDVSEHANGPGRKMGCAIPTPPDGLVLVIHESAALAEIVVPNDPVPRVPYFELLVGLIVGVPSLEAIHTADWNRTLRSHGYERVMHSAETHGVGLYVDGVRIDRSTAGGEISASVNKGAAVSDRNTNVARMGSGILNALHSGGNESLPAWPYPEPRMLPGCRLVRNDLGHVVSRRGESGPRRWGLIDRHEGDFKAFRECFERLLCGATWATAAEPLATAQVQARGSKYRGLTYDSKSLTPEKRGAALRSILTNHRNRTFLETGRFRTEYKVQVPNDGTFNGYAVTPRPGTHGFIPIDIEFRSPGQEFATEEEWSAFDALLERRAKKIGDGPGLCAMFAYLSPYRDADDAAFSWEKRLKLRSDYYVLYERDAASCFNAHGEARGWESGEGRQLLSVDRHELEADIAGRVREAVLELGERKLTLEVRRRSDSEQVKRLRGEIAEAEKEVARLEQEALTQDGLAGVALNQVGDDAAGLYVRAAMRLRQDAAAALSRCRRLEGQLASAVTSDTETLPVDLGSTGALAGLLMGYRGRSVPLEVNDALRRLGLESLRLEKDPSASALVRWSMKIVLPLDDGGAAELQVAGCVRNRKRDGGSTSPVHVDEAMGTALLRDGRSLEEIGVSFGLPREKVVAGIRRWLSRIGVVKRGLRAAIVDVPVEMAATRLLLWCVVSGSLEAPPVSRAMRAHVGRTYLGDLDHPNTYVRHDCAVARRALRVMRDALPASADGIGISELARAVGATRREIAELCKPGGVLIRGHLNRDVLFMRPCPHSDCSDAPAYRWATQYLPVPETMVTGGLLCPTCRRLPDLQFEGVIFDSTYVDNCLNGPANYRHHDLLAAPGTQVLEQAESVVGSTVSRGSRLFNLLEAASELSISPHLLRRWITDPDDPLPHGQVQGQGGAKYVLSRPQLQHARSHARLADLQARSALAVHDTELESRLTLGQLADLVQVAEHHLRRRALAGHLGEVIRVRSQDAAAGGPAPLTLSREVYDPTGAGTPELPAEWVARHRRGLLSMEEACAATGLTPFKIRAAVASGELPSWVTDGGTHRFDPEQLEPCAAKRRARGSMTAARAAARAGVTVSQLDYAVRRGQLSPGRTSGGHARYTESQIDTWVSERGLVQVPLATAH